MPDLIIQRGADPETRATVFIMGPTATGKTDLAMACLQEFPSELISVDSAMVYRGMDIGSAKPTREELRLAPHRLIDICEPYETYSAGRFREDALAEIASIHNAGNTPILVGGTMLYFNALQHGLANLPEADPVVRARLDADVERLGWSGMHQRLAEVDPVSARRIHPNDPQRIHRALEVYEITGRSLTDLWREQEAMRLPYPAIKIALMPPDRDELRKQIARRFDRMLDQGFIEEVKNLRQHIDLKEDMPSMKAVGYRQVWRYLEGEYDRDTMREKAVIATAQLAKRQMTWLRKETECNFFDPATLNSSKLLKKLRNLLS